MSPLSDVVVVRATPVALLTAVTVTPGSTPPLESAIRPEMAPRKVCASQTAAIANIDKRQKPGARRFENDMRPRCGSGFYLPCAVVMALNSRCLVASDAM